MAVKPNIGRVPDLEVASTEDLGQFGSLRYERQRGTVRGTVAPGDDVVGLGTDALPYRYASEFELIRPVDPDARGAVLVDVENRGGPSTLRLVDDLFELGLTYARVQWQTEHCPSVPTRAQGVGLVILRNFGCRFAEYDVRVIAGASQSAWCVNTLLAEGFNVDPTDGNGVFTGAFSYLSAGNWLAINRLADDGRPQYPYVRTDRAPLTASEILARPESDPFFVEITSYTEYYRLRGSVFAAAPLPDRARHYDFPAPHAPAIPHLAEAAFRTMGCHGGVEIPLNPIGSGPYARALLLTLLREPDALPASRWFELGPAPEPSPYFHALPGVTLQVPVVDDDAQPVGGVRFPDVELPLGRAEPAALPPCGASSLSDACGNFGGWQPFDAVELARRYGSADRYVERYSAILDGLIDEGFVLPRDRDGVIEGARRAFARAPRRSGE
jgi:hypothetical protein